MNVINLTVFALVHFVLFLLPGHALTLLLFPLIPNRTGRHFICSFLASCLLGYIAFWLFYWNHEIGKWWAMIALALSLWIIIRDIFSRRQLFKRGHLSDYWMPLGLAFIAGLFYLSLGFLFGGVNAPLHISATRFFSYTLPADNALPLILANKLAAGLPPSPIIDVASSERPPLQAGLVLMQWFLILRPTSAIVTQFRYLVLAVMLQSFVVSGVWIFLRSLRVSFASFCIGLMASIFSGLFFVHTFYVWPKLLATTPLFFLVSIYFAKEPGRNDHIFDGVLMGSCAALACLAHDGAMFALVGIGLAALTLNRWPTLRVLIAAALMMATLQASWACYRKYCDPPGNRIQKMYLAGECWVQDDNRSTWQALVDVYSQLNWSRIIALKSQNFIALSGNIPSGVNEIKFNPAGAIDVLRRFSFFYLIIAMGPLILSILALIWPLSRHRRRDAEGLFPAGLCLLMGLYAAVAWCLIVFGGGLTVIHQGSLFVPAILMLGLALLAAWISPRFGLLILTLQFLWFMVIWLPRPCAPLMRLALDDAMLITAVISGTAMIGLICFSKKAGFYCIPPQLR